MSSYYVGRCKAEAKWMNNDSNRFLMIRFSHSDTLSGSIVMSDVKICFGNRIIYGGTPRYSDRLCSDRRYSDNPQSGRTSGGWQQLNRPTGSIPIGKMPNQIPKIRGSTIVLDVRCNFSGGGGTPDPTGIPSPGSAPLSHLSASINAVLSMHPKPRTIPISSQFLLFLYMPSVLEMYWIVVTADCGNSVCRNRVCRNSVCLPIYGYLSWCLMSCEMLLFVFPHLMLFDASCQYLFPPCVVCICNLVSELTVKTCSNHR